MNSLLNVAFVLNMGSWSGKPGFICDGDRTVRLEWAE
jgi:hypothetical protein